ncbi:hypothetical protein EVAR_11653_1 [Eumeta japonica]|uniref:Uncharacterized protein n=1 Tax=Eumeta variegata TaxID=151549 RepID=A0A4C1WXJ6_EUMVA|nr:hypothetical protein EVAR_11653_1 [Eumeta japonica]
MNYVTVELALRYHVQKLSSNREDVSRSPRNTGTVEPTMSRYSIRALNPSRGSVGQRKTQPAVAQPPVQGRRSRLDFAKETLVIEAAISEKNSLAHLLRSLLLTALEQLMRRYCAAARQAAAHPIVPVLAVSPSIY